MGPSRYLARNRFGRIDLKRFGPLHIGAKRIAIREHEPRHSIGQCCLSNSRGSSDQPGMRDPSTAIGIQQCRLALAMPEKRGGLARMNRCHLCFDLTGAHAELAMFPAPAVKRRSRTALHMLLATMLGSAVASINTHRCG